MRPFGCAVAAVLALTGVAGAQDKKKTPPLAPDSFYALKSKSLEGMDVDLKDFAGKVSLVINLASQ